MTLLVRDEEDIIRENIEFHLSQGVDFIIATDNLSVDDTPDILLEYEKKGVLKYILEREYNYNQHTWVTKMARLACTKYNADWVINNDADEFWWPIDGNLKSTFESIPKTKNTLKAERTDFVAIEKVHPLFYESMIYAKKKSLNSLGKPLPPKVAHLANAKITVLQGNHGVLGFPSGNVIDELIEILHFPLRTRKQFIQKILAGGAAYERNTELAQNVGGTWRHLYKELHDNGLAHFFDENILDTKRLEKNLHEGNLIREERLSNYWKQNKGGR